MLKFDFHTAALASGFNGRSEAAGGDDYESAVDIEIKDIRLTTEDLDRFEAGLGGRLFDEKGHPTLAKFKPLVLSSKIEGATVTIRDGDGDENELIIKDVTLKGVRLQCLADGMTKMRAQLQFHPFDGDLDWLRARLRKEIEVAITVEQWDAQGSLALAA